MAEFSGKCGIITGAASGMGRAAALALAQEGATLLLVGRHLKPLELVQQEIRSWGGQAFLCSADMSIRADVERMVREAAAKLGRIDLAFNNAGGHADFKPIQHTPCEEADYVIDLNFKGVYWCVKYEVEQMEKSGGGVIVNNASVFGLKAMPGIAHYVASKHAVVGLTRAVALECAKQGIRINAICPGGIETPNFLRVTSGDVHAMDTIIPMGRIGHTEEIADAILWLMSSRSSYVTGSTISVDGGMSAG